MPDQEYHWFDELADASSSNDPQIHAVRHAAQRIDPSVDELALARLKRRLRGERLLETKRQRWIRQLSPPIASAAVILLCFSVLLQSGLVSIGDDLSAVEYSLAPAAEYPVVGGQLEFFDQATDRDVGVSSAEEQSASPSALQSPSVPLSTPARTVLRSDKEAARQAAQAKRERSEQDRKRIEQSRYRVEAMRQAEAEQSLLAAWDETWSDAITEPVVAEKTQAKAEKDRPLLSGASVKKKPRLLVELDADSDLTVFEGFIVYKSDDETVLECHDVASCAGLNQLLGRQAGWLPDIKIAQPGILIVLGGLK